MSQREVVVLSGVRTAIGTFGGSLKDVPPTDLAGLVVAEAVKRAGVAPASVGHCVIGNVTHSDRRDMYMSRVAALKGGLPETTPAVTVNRLCGSGLQAFVSAAQLILLGDADVTVTGGAESMSRVPYWLPQARFGARMGDGAMVDAMTGALTCPINDVHMGITAENVAEKWGITREQQDALAVESHQRAAKATAEGRFKSQILPVEIKTRKGVVTFDQDEHVRADASLESMAKLRPVFKKDGTVTAGNASGLNDAAAAMVLMERSAAEAQGLKPLARLVGYSFAGVEPEYMGIGPVPAVKQLLAKHQLNVADIDVWEVNEAFAAQALAVAKDLEIPADKLNANGSGISLGHPIGATGAVITVKALYELERVQGKYAVVTMCIGGGQGIAALFERM
ncbi:acetyl-CoA C-acyltransferase family protein [Simiduia agarivorans]|uniref:Acetyl-CoA acetyltransferase n=1 Tax=Simiduia agarivorans (strain DSM 21679 / JCM 13881 / BCRC 17597 / SA1) TaxID=1117647 RepID=K4KRP3_SIMAS|nr:acetyl-CoA C-acyltransferase family protein [Simiduia agarivorans]AFV00961.1 acetyl-CoA acetyltransferase [Simiduia agarivorans SA1 = DSM 21679]